MHNLSFRNSRLLWFCLLTSLVFSSSLWADPPQENPVPDAYVARAQFTTGIENREPVDQVVSLEFFDGDVYFFTDLRHLEGRKVTHRWEFEGEFIGQITFNVGGPRWRVYSRRTLVPGLEGKWTVMVIDESGWPIHASILQQGVPEQQ
jgi:hypothetical protein